MKVCIVVPAFNEADKIGTLIKDLKEKGFESIVVDDGSKDNTAEIAKDAGAFVIRHYANLGKGASIKEGFNYVMNKTDFEAVIIMDGDGQHHVEDIEGFIKKVNSNEPLMIVGNRMDHAKDMPFVRFATNKSMSFLLSLLCKQNIPDTQCGFRLLTRGVIERLSIKSSNFDTESEMLIDASRKGIKIKSVPIRTIYGDEKSDIHPIKDTIRFFSLFFKHLFKRK